jgi:hypothetical protein
VRRHGMHSELARRAQRTGGAGRAQRADGVCGELMGRARASVRHAQKASRAGSGGASCSKACTMSWQGVRHRGGAVSSVADTGVAGTWLPTYCSMKCLCGIKKLNNSIHQPNIE